MYPPVYPCPYSGAIRRNLSQRSHKPFSRAKTLYSSTGVAGGGATGTRIICIVQRGRAGKARTQVIVGLTGYRGSCQTLVKVARRQIEVGNLK